MRKIGLIALFILVAGVVFFVKQSSTTSQPTPPEMVLVPAGSCQIGSEDFANAKPVHTVTLSNNFYIGKYEVTNQEYADMLNYALAKGYLNTGALDENAKKKEAGGVSKMPMKYQDTWDEHSQIAFKDGKFQPLPGREKSPVVEVTWNGAALYCNILSEIEGLEPLYNLDDWSCQVYGKSGYRLPTEAEWEYAARYDDARKYPWGNEEPDDSYANIKHYIEDPLNVAITPVGAYSPKGDSKLGICDMAGNVAEWCNDWYYDAYVSGPEETDPVGPPACLFINCPPFKEFRPLRVVRGGSYLLDVNFRKEMGVPFVIDSVIHEQAFNNSFRSWEYRGLSRQVEGFRVVKILITDTTIAKVSAAQK